jgi:GH15 family glucan-1,4-alpha-glucosidase
MGMPSAIKDYALIGNCETAALVGRDGSIDWLCVPRFDSEACFAALLGSTENGRWQVAPVGKSKVVRRYRHRTLILETEFQTSSGRATLIDFMPMRDAIPAVIRIVRCDRGAVRMRMELAIRFDFGITIPWVTRNKQGETVAVAGPNRLVLRASQPVEGKGLRTVSEFRLRAGQSAQFELQYGDSFTAIHPGSDVKSLLRKTEESWKRWAARCKYKGPWADVVERSLITLKALTYAPTGGMVAAPTTSLPEVPGAGCNWDYRFCWVRDATFTLLGFLHAGYHREAERWRNWLAHAAAGSPDQMQIMYGVTGERLLREWEVPWLAGFRGASPVRVGNAASEQLQLDVYGELADALHQARSRQGKNDADFDVQFALLSHLEKIWRQPDHGIWEIRGEPQQYTHSKVMAWVAFDRTIKDAQEFKIKAPLDEWRKVRDEIHADVCKLGFNSRLNSFVQFYGSKDVDASLLLLPLVGFLPPLDPRVVGTVRLIEKRLIEGGFVLRYRRGARKKRSGSEEGAFLLCSFLLADYYEVTGRPKEAERLLKRLLKIRNDVGLLAEEYHVGRRELTGNFPQALSHVALINTIINLYSRRGPARQRSTVGARVGPDVKV